MADQVVGDPRAGWARRAMAPGRVNLMGDHTDYNGGLALPMAIQLGTRVGFRSSGHAQLHVRTSADAVALTLDVGARSPAAPMGPALPHWGRLTAAVARHARTTEGGELEIEGTVPSGAGLSSSASLCVALALALGEPGEPLALARLCQRAEAEAGADVGLLDPLVIAAAVPGTAMLIDFADLSFSFVPIPMGVEILIVDSGARRTLEDSPYRQRRSECERAATVLGTSLGRANENDITSIGDPLLARRARHVTSEDRRVQELVQALGDDDLPVAGEIMSASHESLARDFECSTPEVDALVDSLQRTPGVFGARMTGGGFGGAVVALCEPGAVRPDRWPGRAWLAVPSGGATVVADGPLVSPGRGPQPTRRPGPPGTP